METVLIGENVTTIGNYTFYNWANLKFIYIYGEQEPLIGVGASSLILETAVMTPGDYISMSFGSLNISKGRLEECLLLTHTFIKSSTFEESILSNATFRPL